MVMRRATGGLNLQLSTLEVKINVLMEFLQLGQTSSEPLLPFNKALMPNLALAPLLIDTLPGAIVLPRVFFHSTSNQKT